ncbi:Pleiotropic drug resistance protein 3 [Morella rubra]|uniref:Pleiotropic drug resistance protein 3 n=1 Tax=Morella rubra TaxID=262757 RepID=A0A6A1UNG8_9ROSI|nr:Pleiotropic drug resistance protein 3 [Morella rubra]
MAQVLGAEEAESLRIELVELGRSLRSSFQRRSSSFQNSPALSSGSATHDADAEYALQWQQIDRLPTFRRLRASLFSIEDAGEEFDDKGKEMIDVTKLGSLERHGFIERLIKDIRNDNMRLLQKIRRRMDKVGVKYPAIEVRYRNLCVEAVCEVVQGKPLPTVWNSIKSVLYGLKKLAGSKTHEAKINIMEEVSGIIKPGRITLLLGPPGCGKTSLLKALSGNLDQSVKVIGEVSYNGYKLEEFVPQKTSAYISQHDLHLPEMTVREILDFSARCQGVGSREEIMMELIRREKDAGIIPDPDTDTYMKAIAAKGLESNLRTDHVLKIFGLDFCSETQVGDAMRRGLSGGEKRRLTAGEIIVGPTRALFMDEITNGLDSSTAFQVVACLQQFVHITDATILVSLLQPAPETFDLFDDLILMAEGKIVYHGPRDHVLGFFEDCGFRCPERKGVADFLQEVLSRKDQVQYWYRTDLPHNYVSVDMFSGRFMQSIYGKKLDEELSRASEKSKSDKNALSFSAYSIPKWELFKACMSREFILMKRNSFLYAFKTTQLTLIALITMTVFLRTRMNIDIVHSTDYMGALFYALIILLIDGLPELSMTVRRLPFFFKQKQLCFFPAWAYTVPVCIMKVPISLVQSLAWTCLTYYVIGYSPEVERFLRQFLLLFGLSLASTSMFRFLASVFQTNAAATTAASFAIYLVILLGGFIITHPSMPGWLKWSFWISPMTYGEIAISLNEFHAPRWQKMLSPNITLGQEILGGRGLNFKGYFYWISVAALFGFAILFNAGFTLALSFLKTPGLSRVIISHEKLSQVHGSQESNSDAHEGEKSENSGKETNIKPNKGRMVLPFSPLAVVFQDVQYYVDTPLELKEQGFVDKKLQLLCDITGSLRPTVLTALMGVSGAGKTTLLDVLAGRKTSGCMEGHIIVGGYPKEFVNEVLETIELDGVKDALVGTPGVSGLSNEQRKRLTIAVELVANPSIIFMDEPTSGLDARAAAIVMRAVKNVVDTGRTIVCTIHQPSIDIFESFDEVKLFLSFCLPKK